MGRFACVVPLATTPCSFGLAALDADLPPANGVMNIVGTKPLMAAIVA